MRGSVGFPRLRQELPEKSEKRVIADVAKQSLLQKEIASSRLASAVRNDSSPSF